MKSQKKVFIRGFNCLIDESIAPHIQWLNEHGFHTIGCCSGNIIDHNRNPDYPEIQFFTELISNDKIMLIIKTAIEIKLNFSYDFNESPILTENQIESKNQLHINWKYPAELDLFIHVLKHNLKTVN